MGVKCCAVIHLHTGTRGTLTKDLEKLKQLQDEHMHNSGFAQETNWFRWFLSTNWTATLGSAIGLMLCIMALLASCLIPLGHRFIHIGVHNVAGKHVVVHA